VVRAPVRVLADRPEHQRPRDQLPLLDRPAQAEADAFGPLPEPAPVDDLADAFRTGTGLPCDCHGAEGCIAPERMLGPWARLSLVSTILPALEGVVDGLIEP
jgi:hypothetical protein